MTAGDHEQESHLRHARMATWFTGVLASIVGFATAVRPLVSDIGLTFTLIGVVDTALYAGCWYAMHSGRVVRHAPHLLVGLSTVLTVPLMLVSGGPDSQFAVLAPLFPICGVMLGGRRLAIGITVFWALTLTVMHFVAPLLTDLTGEPFHAPKSSSRTFWLVLASIVALSFALHFDRVSQALHQRLRQMAERDPLTGVGNRRALDIALTRSLSFAHRKGGSVTLVMLDLDNFKRFNDSRGHAEGDRALIRIAETLVAHCRTGQDSVARFGGEEFVLVLGQTDREAARFAVEKIRRAVADLGLRYDDVSEDVVTITLGYTSVAGDAEPDHDDLLREADAALYAGKRRGRNRAVSAAELPDGPERLATETR